MAPIALLVGNAHVHRRKRSEGTPVERATRAPAAQHVLFFQLGKITDICECGWLVN